MTRRRTKKKKKKADRRAAATRPAETRTSEAATIAWTLTVITVLGCDIGAIAASFYTGARPDSVLIAALFESLMFAAVAIGIISLMLLPVVLKVRRQPPPRAFTVFAVLVAAAPIVAVVARAAQ